MPHLGRQYPYLVEFWAGNGWYWPNYLPWKYIADFHPGVSGIWSFLGDALNIVSDPGIPSSDRATVSWVFTFDDTNGHNVMTLTASFHRDDPAHELQWVLLWNLDGLDFATAYTDANFDSQVPSPGAWSEGTDIATGLPCDPPGGHTGVADYDQGGTPFPHPTGGPPPS